MNSAVALKRSKTYTEESLLGGGAVVGKNVTISSITSIDGGNRVTFSYTLDNGTVKTSTMDVMNGKDGADGLSGNDGKDGTDGIGISKIEKIGTVDLVDTYRITFTDNSTFDYEITNGKDGTSGEGVSTWSEISGKPFETLSTDFSVENGELKFVGGTGGSGEENVIESIKVNGVAQTVAADKSVDITVPDAYDDTALSQRVTDIESDYLKADDISGKVDKVDGKSLIADSEITRLASVDNYNDTEVKSQIQAVANGLMDSVGYSADYKTIDIIAKNGVKKSVNVAPIISHASITELSDVDITNKDNGKALVYNSASGKHEYTTISSTDEKVKMDSSSDSKYLGELLDNVTITNENGELKVKKLDGQEVTITEINYLKGLTMNVMDLVNMFSNGGVKIINTPVATYAELLNIDKSAFIEGISYLVYVLADENHDNAKTTYLVDKDSETPTYFGFADSQRDFTTSPIDLATEITGKLGISNMDSDAIKALFTVDDTYKTETATNNAFSTHGAKALYDELLLAIGNKANDSDLTAHKDDADIHVSTEDRTKWDSAKTHADSAHAPSNAQANVIETVKVNGSALSVSDKAVNVTVPTTVSELTDSADYAKKTDIPTTLPANGGNADTVNNHTVKSDVPENSVFTDTIYDDTEVKESIAELNSNLNSNITNNLINPQNTGSYTSNGVTMTYNGDGTYTLNGTNTGSISWFNLGINDGKTKAKGLKLLGCPKRGSKYDISLRVNFTDGTYRDSTTIKGIIIDYDRIIQHYEIRISEGTTWNNEILKPMLTTNLNATYDDFVPYTGDSGSLNKDVGVIKKEVAAQNASLSVIGKCKNLLKPILQTTVQNGVTCTNNGDGTYTFTGTATGTATFIVKDMMDFVKKHINKDIRLVGCPKNGGVGNKYRLQFWGDPNSPVYDVGNGNNIHFESIAKDANIAIIIDTGIHANNLVFKPMLTTDLSATYDDFVPYTGDGETLASDVAEIKNDLGGLTFSASGTTLTITDGTNTWTLGANS